MRRVFLLGFIWGWSFFLIKKALPGFTPWEIAFARTALGALTLFLVARFRRLALPRDARLWAHLGVLAIVSNAIPFATQSVAQTHITSTLTSVLNATTPLFTAIIGALGFSDRLRRSQIAGLLLGFVGVVVAAGVGGSDLHGSALTGIGLMLSSTLSYGIGFNYARRNVSGVVVPELIALGQLSVASVLLVVPAALSNASSDRSPGLVSVFALLVLGAVGTGLSWILNFRNLAEVGPANASAVTFIVPIVAFLLGIGLLDEPFRVRHVLGAVVTLLGVALLQGRIRLQRRRPQPAP